MPRGRCCDTWLPFPQDIRKPLLKLGEIYGRSFQFSKSGVSSVRRLKEARNCTLDHRRTAGRGHTQRAHGSVQDSLISMTNSGASSPRRVTGTRQRGQRRRCGRCCLPCLVVSRKQEGVAMVSWPLLACPLTPVWTPVLTGICSVSPKCF